MSEHEISSYLKNKAAANRIPMVSAFEISPVCNFKCKMCYVRKTADEAEKQGGILPVDWWIDTAEQAREEGLLYPLITGGEPFLYPGIRRLLETLNRSGLFYTMNTNGALITEEVIEWLSEIPPIRLNITLYGASDETYGRLCGDPKGFTKVRRAVELLKKAGISHRFNCSLTRQNMHDLKHIIEYGKSVENPVKIATYMFPPIRRLEDTFGHNDRMTPEECGYQKVLADYYQLSPESFERSAKYYCQFTPLEEIDFDSLPEGPGEYMHCLAGKCSYWVDWKGNLSACGMMNSPRISLKTTAFKDAWKEIVDYADHTVCRKACSGCPNNKICHTCITMVYSETGTINGRPEYYCRMMDAQAKAYRELLQKRDPEALA